jgi:hypothetical protein
MRSAAALLCLVLVSACAPGTGAALTAEDAKSKLAVKDGALGRLASAQLSVVTQQAQAWAAAHGGQMEGFSDDLRTTQPSVASTAADLTDTSVTFALGNGHCLTAALPSGAQADVAC